MKKMQNKQWKDIPTSQKRRIGILSIVELVLTSIALWDLSHRPAGQVNGKKLVWTLVSFIQPIGPIAYLLFGRKQS